MTADPQRLVERAKEARRVELEQIAEEERRARDAHRPITTGLVERPKVWLNLRRGPHIGALITAGLGAWFAVGFVPLPELRSVAILCAVIGAAATAWLVRSWITLRAWRTRVPFTIEGWASLVDQELFWIDDLWWHVTVAVHGSIAPSTLASAFEKLRARARATYYAPESRSDDQRLWWHVEEGVAIGSANRNTAHAFARWCLDDLAPLAKDGSIERVVLTVAGGPVSVSRPSTD